MNKSMYESKREALASFKKDVEEAGKRKQKEQEAIKQYADVNPDDYSNNNRAFENDMVKFKVSSEIMLQQLDEYERKKRELLYVNKGRISFNIDYNPEIDKMMAIKRKVPQEFLDKIQDDLDYRETLKERLIDDKEMRIEEECPFVPAISNNSRAICERKNLKPVHERYDDEIRAKKKRVEELKATLDKQKQEQEDKENTKYFQTTGKKYKDTYKNNYAWYTRKNQKIVEEQVRKLEDTLNEKEHRPVLNPKSTNLMEGTSFVERQENFNKRREGRKKELERKTNNFSHSPNLNKNSIKIAEQLKKKQLIKTMINQIEENEEKYKKETEDADNMIFRKVVSRSKSKSSRPHSRAKTPTYIPGSSGTINGSRVYNTPGRTGKTIIAKLPQKSLNPTTAEKKTPKDLSALRAGASPLRANRTARNEKSPSPMKLKSDRKTRENINYHGEVGQDETHVYVPDRSTLPVVKMLKEKGKIYRAE